MHASLHRTAACEQIAGRGSALQGTEREFVENLMRRALEAAPA